MRIIPINRRLVFTWALQAASWKPSAKGRRTRSRVLERMTAHVPSVARRAEPTTRRFARAVPAAMMLAALFITVLGTCTVVAVHSARALAGICQ